MYVELEVFSRDYKLLFWFPTKLVRDDGTGRKGDRQRREHSALRAAAAGGSGLAARHWLSPPPPTNERSPAVTSRSGSNNLASGRGRPQSTPTSA